MYKYLFKCTYVYMDLHWRLQCAATNCLHFRTAKQADMRIYFAKTLFIYSCAYVYI